MRSGLRKAIGVAAFATALVGPATSRAGAEPPADGFYRASPAAPTSPPTEAKPGEALALRIEQAVLSAKDNANERFSLELRVPYDAALSPPGSLILVVGGEVHVSSGGGSSGTTWSHPWFALRGRATAEAVGKHLGIAPRLRRHPGHRLEVSFVPAKPAFAPGEPVRATFRMKNVGDSPVAFVHGGRNRAPRDNQYDFLARLGGRLVPDVGNNVHYGGLSQRRVIPPGGTFEEEVDLGKWFAFTERGLYEIVGMYALTLLDPATDDQIPLWEDHAAAPFLVEVAAVAPKPARLDLGSPAGFDVPGQEGALRVEVTATEVLAATAGGEPARVRLRVRLVRGDGTDAGVAATDPEGRGVEESSPAWTGLVAGGTRASVFFEHIQVRRDVPAGFAGVGVGVTPTLDETGHVSVDVESHVIICIR